MYRVKKMTTKTLLTEIILKKLEDEKKDKTNFLTITYDIPSENLTNIEEDLKRQFLNKRLALLSYVNIVGLRLNNSTYVVNIDRIDELLKYFEQLYAEHMERVNVKIVGNAYQDVVKEVIVKDIERIRDESKRDLEILESEIKDVNKEHDDYFGRGKRKVDFTVIEGKFAKIKKKLYAYNKILQTLNNRIEDLGKLDLPLSIRFVPMKDKLVEYRRNLLNSCKD